jgi:hypothetical protein
LLPNILALKEIPDHRKLASSPQNLMDNSLVLIALHGHAKTKDVVHSAVCEAPRAGNAKNAAK